MELMDLKRWPRKNDAASIRARQEALGLSDGVTSIDLSPFVNAQEMLTGAAVIPVSVVGPLELELGEYELEEPFGRVSETGRTRDAVYVPLAHTEGGLSASLYRGARAAAESGGFRTYVLRDRISRASSTLTWRRCAGGSRSATTSGSPPTRSSARSRRTSSARCATSCGRSRPATRAGRT